MEDARLVNGMTADELAEVQRIHDVMLKAVDKDIWLLAQFRDNGVRAHLDVSESPVLVFNPRSETPVSE